ncbi:MAG: hypothetical protein NTY19_43365 [Planctomycetota bacterium]|nr:hypothetical protein [Planctomycetota bacterium]
MVPYSRVCAVSFSPDGRTLATASIHETVRLWDVQTGQPHGEPLEHDGAVWTVSFSPDGRVLASRSKGRDEPIGEARLWDVPTPVPDQPERIWLAVDVASWHTFENGLVRVLSQAEWLERKKRLEAMGGDCLHRKWEDLTEQEKHELRTPVVD